MALGSLRGLTVRGTHDTLIEGVAIGGFGTGISIRPEESESPLRTKICGSYLGVELNGEFTAPNEVGIEIYGSGDERPEATTIGDGASCAGNVISGNTVAGVVDSGVETKIAADRIGIGPASTEGREMPNGGAGVIEEAEASGTMIGGTVPGAGETNLIDFNHGPGVKVESPASKVSIRRNSISQNEGLGIELAGGPAAPTLEKVELTPGDELFVEGKVQAGESETVELEFFGSYACEAGGTGQGQTILGSHGLAVVPGANTFSFTLPVDPPVADSGYTATSTGEEGVGTTTEFSECLTYEAERTFTVNTLDDESHPGECTSLCSLREAISLANINAAKDTIDFAAGAEGVIDVEGFPLGEIEEPVEIDGTSAPGYAGEPVVMLDGTGSFNEGPTVGLDVLGGAGGTVIKGLAIGGFDREVELSGATASQLCSSWIGVELDGVTALAKEVGVVVGQGTGNEVGAGCGAGAAPNVISGNSEAGIVDYATHTLIEGNLIGTDAAGTGALANGTGVIVGPEAVESRVGLNLGESPTGEGNTIAHNSAPGFSSKPARPRPRSAAARSSPTAAVRSNSKRRVPFPRRRSKRSRRVPPAPPSSSR